MQPATPPAPPPDLVPIRRVLVSVFDKTGLDRLAAALKTAGVEVVSTGGTARALAAHGLDVVDISAVTGFPEVLDGRVTVRVADNGPGIPLAERNAVFRRFVRLGSELERSTPGTGLGLFLVRSLVKQLRGKVAAKGRIGQRGSIFEVELPAAAQAP